VLLRIPVRISGIVSKSTCGGILLLVAAEGTYAVIIVPLKVDAALDAEPLICERHHVNAVQYYWCPPIEGDGNYNVITYERFLLFYRGTVDKVLAHIREGNAKAAREYYNSGEDDPLAVLVPWKPATYASERLKPLSGGARTVIWTFILCAEKKGLRIPSLCYNYIAYLGGGPMGPVKECERDCGEDERRRLLGVHGVLVTEWAAAEERLLAITARLAGVAALIKHEEEGIHGLGLAMVGGS
jgi:hypothetical protein